MLDYYYEIQFNNVGKKVLYKIDEFFLFISKAITDDIIIT